MQWPRAQTPLRLVVHPDGRKFTAKARPCAAAWRKRWASTACSWTPTISTTLDHTRSVLALVRARVRRGDRLARVAGAHIVIHQPWHKGGSGGKVGNRIIRALAAPGIADTQAGFKMFSGRCIDDILPRLTIERWGFDVELIVAARCRGFQVKELPITWRNSFASTVPATAYAQVLGEVWRVRRQRAAGFYN